MDEEKAYQERNYQHQIREHLYITNYFGAKNKTQLEDNQITHILIIGQNLKQWYPNDFTYKQIEIPDNANVDILGYFPDAFQFIDEGIQQGNVLIHCAAGRSRSASFLIGYIMQAEKKPYREVLDEVNAIRMTSLNGGFEMMLEDYSVKVLNKVET
eukprot:TRINITY_DN9815_c0_g1_i1.p1 TRINITY_DN9815_c0_g1~~TRINITY_DN9815_c0_g1_i1.p1  ORF type:complete len:156 (+),score=28.87 TRINITY_DN9815_c0_g1_i1:52-519(+)